MNTFVRDIKNDDGSTDTLVISSNDSHKININKNFKISNNYHKNNIFKKSILATDIGFNNNMFAYILLTSLVMVIFGIVIMFYNYRIY